MEKKQEKKKLGLTTLIFISLLLGAGFGIILHYWIPEGYVRDTVIINGVFYVVGNGFLRAMQMLVVPLVFCSIVCGSMSIGDTKTLGKVGVKAMGFYLVTTALAITLALSVANLIDPGVGMDVSSLETAEAAAAAENISFADTLLNIIPKNPIQGLAEGDMLQIIFFAIFVGILLAKRGERSAAVAQFFSQFNDLMMDMTMAVDESGSDRSILPDREDICRDWFRCISSDAEIYGGSFLSIDASGIWSIPDFTEVADGTESDQIYQEILSGHGICIFHGDLNVMIPLSIETLDKKMGVSKRISSFTIPLGATINMDGTAIMQGVAVVFVSQAFGIPLTLTDYLTVIATATIASIGTAGVPSVGLITLSMVFTSVGLPVEGIALIMGIDRILDMTRTAVNITGDAVCTTIIAHQNKELRREVYERMEQKGE